MSRRRSNDEIVEEVLNLMESWITNLIDNRTQDAEASCSSGSPWFDRDRLKKALLSAVVEVETQDTPDLVPTGGGEQP